eukprot:g15555.t1
MSAPAEDTNAFSGLQSELDKVVSGMGETATTSPTHELSTKQSRRAQRIFAGDFYRQSPPAEKDSAGKAKTAAVGSGDKRGPHDRSKFPAIQKPPKGGNYSDNTRKTEERKAKDKQALDALLHSFTPTGSLSANSDLQSSSSNAEDCNAGAGSSATESSTQATAMRWDSLASYIVNFQEEAMLQKAPKSRVSSPDVGVGAAGAGGPKEKQMSGSNSQSPGMKSRSPNLKSRSPKGRAREPTADEVNFNQRAAQRKLDCLAGVASSPKLIASPVLQPVVLSVNGNPKGASALPEKVGAAAGGAKLFEHQQYQVELAAAGASAAAATALPKVQPWSSLVPSMHEPATTSNRATAPAALVNMREQLNRAKLAAGEQMKSSSTGRATAGSSAAGDLSSTEAAPSSSTAEDKNDTTDFSELSGAEGRKRQNAGANAPSGGARNKITTITRDPAAIYLSTSGQYIVMDEANKKQAAATTAEDTTSSASQGDAGAAEEAWNGYGSSSLNPMAAAYPPGGAAMMNPTMASYYAAACNSIHMLRTQQMMAAAYHNPHLMAAAYPYATAQANAGAGQYGAPGAANANYASQYAQSAAMAQVHEAHAQEVAAVQAAMIEATKKEKQFASEQKAPATVRSTFGNAPPGLGLEAAEMPRESAKGSVPAKRENKRESTNIVEIKRDKKLVEVDPMALAAAASYGSGQYATGADYWGGADYSQAQAYGGYDASAWAAWYG